MSTYALDMTLIDFTTDHQQDDLERQVHSSTLSRSGGQSVRIAVHAAPTSAGNTQVWYACSVLSASSDRPDALPSGAVLRDYMIDSVLGHGGFGIVYRARHKELGHCVAIKEYLPADLAVREGETVAPRRADCEEYFSEGLRRFREEATVLINLPSHPNVIACKDFFRCNGTAYLVMDFVDGQPLSAVLSAREAEGRPFNQAQLMAVAVPLAEGLMHVHRAGLIHRDIKPANILIRRDDESPILIDFGATKQSVAGHTRSLAPYTDGYAALEQVAGGRIGPWTDIYGYGAVLWRIVAGGNAAGKAPNPTKVEKRMSAWLHGSDDPLNSIRELSVGHFSEQLVALINRCMALNDKDRIQDCSELTEMLAESIESESNVDVTKRKSTDYRKTNDAKAQQVLGRGQSRANHRDTVDHHIRGLVAIRDTHLLSVMLRIALGLNICLAALVTWSAMIESARQPIVAQWKFYLFTTCVILFSRWTYFLSQNAHIVNGHSMRFTPTWAVSWYFVPLANLWKPYQAMKEIARAFDSDDPQDLRQLRRPVVLPIWWIFWVAYNHIFSSNEWLLMLGSSLGSVGILDNSRSELILLLFELPATVACIALVGFLQDMQTNSTDSLMNENQVSRAFFTNSHQ